jgi:hypothetical protein
MSSSIQIQSPFLDVRSFEMQTDTDVRRRGLSSPFVEAFTLESFETSSNSREADRRVLLAQLYEESLDEAIYELVGELVDSTGGRSGLAAGKLRLAPLADDMETLLQRAADEFGSRDAAGITESEIDDVFSRIAAERRVAPEFEHFFGAIKKAVTRAAKGAVNLAKKGIGAAAKLGLGPLLARLKPIVPRILKAVLQRAINRLPAALRPSATKLAAKLPELFRTEVDWTGDGDEVALDVGFIQREFDESVADVVLGESDAEPEEETTRWSEPDGAGHAGISDLDAARERFIDDLGRLDDAGDAGPAVERFVPALLPALKLAVRLAGRKRVVSLLSRIASQFVGRFVGPAASGALSTALVDAGLGLLGLEVSTPDQRRTANAALAATVEDTVRRVAALPDAVLDNETLAEGSILRAFEEAAASNLPPLLPDAVYRRRPELVETDSHRGTWIPYPIRGPKRYKKFSRVIRTRITPHAAMTVTTFGEAPLAQFLQEQLGLEPGEDVEGDLHLYESMAGTHLQEVARLEANGNGAANITEFHPLTPEAAALLVREPGLGRQLSAESHASPRSLAVGQRFFRIAVPGRRIAAIPGEKGRARRRTSLHTVFDFPGDRIRLYLFLSERRAQELAVSVRKEEHAGAVATALKGFIVRGLARATSGAASGGIRLVHEALPLEEARGAALARLPKSAVQAFTSRIGEWTLTALSDFLSTQSARFIAATEDANDGVTFVITLVNPPGMAAMRKAIAGAGANGGASLSGAPAAVQVDVTPGFTNG